MCLDAQTHPSKMGGENQTDPEDSCDYDNKLVVTSKLGGENQTDPENRLFLTISCL